MKCEHHWVETECRWELICTKCKKIATKEPMPIVTESVWREQKEVPFELRLDISIS